MILLLVWGLIVGCSSSDEVKVSTANKVKDSGNQDQLLKAQSTPPRHEGEGSAQISKVRTTDRVFALTFNGLAKADTMHALLDALDKAEMKATFFLPGMRVAEEPDLAKEIKNRGHQIENNTLNQLHMPSLDYERMYQEVQLANDVIEQHTGVRPSYIRTRSGDIPEDLPLIAAQLEMKGVVSSSINPRDRDLQDAEALAKYMIRFMTRGAIVHLNTDINPEVVRAVELLSEKVNTIKYRSVTLTDLLAREQTIKPGKEIDGYYASKEDLTTKGTPYKLVKRMDTDGLPPGEKIVALTLDDWGSDATVTKILDILDEYEVPATFFLRMNGAEVNPSLAKAMLEAGHDVANHTYSHLVVTGLEDQVLQNEVVKAHQVLTEALQEKPTMLFRPPTGAIDERSAQLIAAAGYPVIALYDVTTLDWDTSRSAADLLQTVKDRTVNGSIILVHILDDLNTIEALPMIIDYLRSENYRFVKMKDYIDMSLLDSEDE